MRHESLVAGLLALSLFAPPAQAASPGGNGTLAFLSDRRFEGQNPAAAGWHIFAAGPDGLAATPLTRQSTIGYGVGHQNFAWSPDGRWIAFASDRDSNNFPAIFVMRADGSDARRITRPFESAVNPSWSPDGRHIVFQGWRGINPPSPIPGNSTYNLYVVEADGSDEREIPRDRYAFSQPAWSPDGREIAVEVATRWSVDLELIPADGGGAGRPLVRTGDAWESAPTWSPDGTQIAFQSRTADADTTEIHVVDARDGSARRELTSGFAGDAMAPAWSPDGRRIAFTGWIDGNVDIYVMDAAGGPAERVTSHPAVDHQASWQPLERSSAAPQAPELEVAPPPPVVEEPEREVAAPRISVTGAFSRCRGRARLLRVRIDHASAMRSVHVHLGTRLVRETRRKEFWLRVVPSRGAKRLTIRAATVDGATATARRSLRVCRV